MDVVAAASGYISKMVTVGESAGASSKMKILLLDSETVGDLYLASNILVSIANSYCDRSLLFRPQLPSLPSSIMRSTSLTA